METKIKIPTELSEISLGDYQRFVDVSEKSNDDTFIFEKMVEIFCNIQLMEVIQIKWTDVQYIANKITQAFQKKPEFKNRFKIKDIEFGFIPSLEDISFGEFIDLQNNIDKIEDFHKAMAVMYRPIIESRKDKYLIEEYVSSANYSEVMKFAPVDVALAAKVFFCDLQKELLSSTIIYLKDLMMKEDSESFRKEFSLQNNGVGIVQFMESQVEIYKNLEALQNCPYMTALPSYLLKSKSEISKIMRYNDN
tara:strand:- start:108 stop:857 length:750 start_codon:yes stop_codon:yes gene_type:complete